MTRRNFKVYADLGIDIHATTRTLAVLDTGAGPNFIRKTSLPTGAEAHIAYGPLPDIADANNNPIKARGTIRLLVRLGPRSLWITFIVCDALTAPAIIGCDFCDRHVEAIQPQKRTVELDDGFLKSGTAP